MTKYITQKLPTLIDDSEQISDDQNVQQAAQLAVYIQFAPPKI